jgi:gamma-glutamyl-gamma-aminobutyrate hydrolase PuuD
MSAKTKEKIRPKVYVIGGGYDYIALMYRLGCDGAKGVEDADVVLFTGGEDVNPELYKEVPLATTNFSRLRDQKESLIFDACLEREIPMVGICRGGQFLNVKNGGKMWQHVKNHCGSHIARIEVPPFNKGKKDQDLRRTIEVTSTHHQMMIPTEDAVILATALVATEKSNVAYTKIGITEDDPDTEVCAYPDTNSLCFQPHPEMHSATPECIDFFEECLDNWIYPHIKDRQVQMIHNQGSTKVC